MKELELTPEDILAEDVTEALDAPPSATVIKYRWLRWLLERWGTERPRLDATREFRQQQDIER